MPLARVVAVAPGSPADVAGVLVGDELVDVNGEELRDVIRYQVQVDEPQVALTLRRQDTTVAVELTKPAGAPLGVELHSAVFDRVRTCDNHCPFCFIYQLPKGMRRSLYLKDDDYRLSHLYGNFTTLTRFTEADLERVVTEGLGPLYVSIHATDPDVRTQLLRNRRGATSLRWLGALLDAGVAVHGQIVVCPGLNDGAVLDDTLLGILDRFPALATVGAVPLGVSDHTTEPDMRPHTTAEANAVLDTIETWQSRYLAALGHRMIFAADEYYLMADRPFPAADAYEGFAQHENGIGMARTFAAEVDAALAGHAVRGVGTRAGFFASVDGAPAEGYRAPRLRHRQLAVRDARADAAIVLLTGAYGARVLAPHLDALGDAAGVDIRAHVVPNAFFGGNIGVTGLLTGADVAAALDSLPDGVRVLLPDVVLSEDRFLDGATLADLPRPVEVVGTDGASLVGAVRRDLAAVMATPPVVAVVGRPNVGKSTLVNRVVGRREAIVQEKPGVTRDRKELPADWNGREFLMVDTGGWIATDEPLAKQVSLQAERAIREADVIIHVVDVTVGATEEDAEVARILQRATTPVLLVANKADDDRRESEIWPLTKLGLGDPHPVSAIHGRGSGDLLDALVKVLPPAPEAPEPEPGEHPFSVAIVGRPNVGKSTLFNRLVGDERSVTHDMPGTTRDTIDTIVETDGGVIRFIDTAGMRRRSRVDEPTEYYSVLRALDAVDRADAALFVIDATEGVSHQDQRLAERVDGAGTAIVVVLNKWDLVPTEEREQIKIDVQDRLGFLGYAPILQIAALTGRNLRHVMPALLEAQTAYHTRIPTAKLNQVIRDAQQRHPPPLDKKHRPRIQYATQGAADPPTFTLFATRMLPPTYLRYIERRIREAFDLGPTPIKIRVRRRQD